jgi:porin
MNKKYPWAITGLLFAALVIALPAAASGDRKSGYDNKPGFAGPAESGALLKDADKVKEPALRFPEIDNFLKPWFDWKGQLKKDYGLELGLAYTATYQSANNAPAGGDDEAGSGIFRLSGRWTLLSNEIGDTGTLVATVDHRHAYTDSAPGSFGYAGNYGISATLFSDVDDVLVDLNWQQSFGGNRTGIVIGRYDPNDYFDVLGYSIPWTTFQNLNILFNGSIALPDNSTGVGAGVWLNEQWYARAAANDVNGVVTDSDFEFDSDELFKVAEVGWSPSREQRYFQNVHLTYWHADEKENGGSEESDGFTVGANWTWDLRWMAFGKAGWSDGSAPLFNESYTLGFLRYFGKRSDLLGIAINWGEAPNGSGIADQTTTEIFYRLQLAQNLAITPSVQYIRDPGLNPDEDSLTIIGLRLRWTL